MIAPATSLLVVFEVVPVVLLNAEFWPSVSPVKAFMICWIMLVLVLNIAVIGVVVAAG